MLSTCQRCIRTGVSDLSGQNTPSRPTFLFLPRLEEPEIPKVIEHSVERAALKKSVNHFSCGCALFSCLSEVCKIANQGIVVADNAGKIRFATEKAVGWLGEYFEEPHSPALPNQVKDWLQERSSKPFNYERLTGGLREISIQRGPKRLTIQSLSPLQAREHRLLLTESTDSLDPTPLESLGLTKREAEVLFWAGQAKRNAEIGQILAMGERTVRTHMGRILAKLGVENRTAAANIATEFLQRSMPAIDHKAPMYANGRE